MSRWPLYVLGGAVAALAFVAAVRLTRTSSADAGSAASPAAESAAGSSGADSATRARRAPGVNPRREPPLFAGIALSPVQRTRLRLIQTKYADEMRAAWERMAPERRALRDARRSGDSAAARQAWERSAGARAELKAIGSKMRAEMREVLTPEQRPRFDANAATVERRAADLDRRQGMGMMAPPRPRARADSGGR